VSKRKIEEEDKEGCGSRTAAMIVEVMLLITMILVLAVVVV